MRAVQIDRFGGPEVLEINEVPRPSMRDGEVLVRSIATSINPIDCKLRSKDRQLGLPLTLGWDLSGVVVDSTVSDFSAGDRVIAMSNVVYTRNGTWADFVALPLGDVAPAPDNVTMLEAATLPLVGMTALQAWRSITVGRSDRVLVIGAAGAIGAHLVQHAVNARVSVDGIVRRNRQVGVVKEFGADLVTTNCALLSKLAYDVIFDTVGLPELDSSARQLLKPNGQYVMLPSAADLPGDVNARRVFVERDPAGLKELADMVENGKIRLRVAASYPVCDVRAAHRHFEGGSLLGKVVMKF
jgi:NADPH:quinone reductase-like Zn-dependent oxidoreductase